MARFVLDAGTLLHVLESGRTVELRHQLVAPASMLLVAMSAFTACLVARHHLSRSGEEGRAHA